MRTLPHHVLQHQGSSRLTTRRQCIRILQVAALETMGNIFTFIVFDCCKLSMVTLKSFRVTHNYTYQGVVCNGSH